MLLRSLVVITGCDHWLCGLGGLCTIEQQEHSGHVSGTSILLSAAFAVTCVLVTWGLPVSQEAEDPQTQESGVAC